MAHPSRVGGDQRSDACVMNLTAPVGPPAPSQPETR